MRWGQPQHWAWLSAALGEAPGHSILYYRDKDGTQMGPQMCPNQTEVGETEASLCPAIKGGVRGGLDHQCWRRKGL